MLYDVSRVPHVYMFSGFPARVDDRALAQSKKSDAADDQFWFDEHYDATYRLRPPSPLEVIAFLLPPLSEVFVGLLPNGSHVRVFMTPRQDPNASPMQDAADDDEPVAVACDFDAIRDFFVNQRSSHRC